MNREFAVLFIFMGICLTIAATFPNSENRKTETNPIPVFQQPATPTPRPNCPVPSYPAAAYGRNPYPTEIAPYFNRAGLNQLATSGPTLPTLTPNQSPYVPCLLLHAIAYQESGWKHFEANYNNYGYAKISSACAYGFMQVASGMTGGGGFDQNRANQEVAYNLGAGALNLIKKWNALKLTSGGFPGGAYIVGQGNPQIAEDWYYAVWSYNAWGQINNPNNNCVVIPWDPVSCRGQRNPNRPPFDGSQNTLAYPYQELIWGYAAHPPTYNGVPLWPAVNLSLPKWTDVGGAAEPYYPNKRLPRPTPSHTSCGSLYLPIILKNWIGLKCKEFAKIWYPAGTNACNPSVSNCADGDGQPDKVWAGPWNTGYHQVEFLPQLVLTQTVIGAYWKSYEGVYGDLYIEAKLNGEWSQVHTSLSQSTTEEGRWEQVGLGEYADRYISGLRLGFSTSVGTPGHKFMVDGYRIVNFIRCAE